MSKIFRFNVLAIAMMVLLPFLLMGYLLGKSERIVLTDAERLARTYSNWWLKLIVAFIMCIGWIYIINPQGRGASTLDQFLIATDLQQENTLPIYIQSKEDMTPVIAGFLGWYLHLIGYVFTKLIHHDVISARVYSLLFKKFLVTYGIALVLPQTGLVAEENSSVAFFMFLIGLFPLSAMSLLIESASKIGAGSKNSVGNLSVLPGISRWQILRLEEEGIDSMASLANTSEKTINENLQTIKNLVRYWVDIAQLYTIIGHEAYEKLRSYCITASEFLQLADNPDFQKTVHELQGISEAKEIARQIENTFKLKIENS